MSFLNIMKIVAALTVLICAAIVSIRKYLSMTETQRAEYISKILEHLAKSALRLVESAEHDLDYDPGTGAGPFKKSWVVTELYKLVPENLKPYITSEQLSAMTEAALVEAEKLWETEAFKANLYFKK